MRLPLTARRCGDREIWGLANAGPVCKWEHEHRFWGLANPESLSSGSAAAGHQLLVTLMDTLSNAWKPGCQEDGSWRGVIW